MSEKRKQERKEERKKLMAFTPAYDLHQNILLGYLGNLSLQGAMVLGKKPGEIDTKLTLAIEFHETPETPATRMTLPVRVAWCQQEGNSTDYITGFEFLELTDQNKRVIEAVLERFQFRPAGDAHRWAPQDL
jgi:hypothetical protein